MNKIYKLSEGALEAIMNGGTILDPIVQVLGSKKMSSSVRDSERYRLLLSDGRYKVNVAMYSVKVWSEEVAHALEVHSIIKLKRYLSNVINTKDKRDTRVLLILDLELVMRGSFLGHVIGNPVSLHDCDTSTSSQSSYSSAISSPPPPKNECPIHLSRTRDIAPIASLNPFHNDWVIRARVVNKTNIRNWCNAKGEGKLFSVDLIDESGEIRCTAFRELVDKFFESFQVDKVYYVSKCLLQPINRQFCSLKHEFEMTCTPVTQIEESLTDNTVIPQLQYNFVSLDKLAIMEPGSVVDVIAICRNVSDLQIFTSRSTNKELKKKELLLVDQTNIGISLTLWGHDAESFNATNSPVILLKNAKIYEFRDVKSLALVPGSQIKINPNNPESRGLLSWYDSQGKHLDVKNISARNTIGGHFPWMTFKEMHQMNTDQATKGIFFQTFAKILLVRLERAVYKSCPSPNCQKKIVDLENGMYRCDKCNREFPNFKYRLLVSMNISDGSSSQWVTCFSEVAETILGKSAQEIGEAMETDQDDVAKLFEEPQFKQFVFKCKAKLDTYNDEQKLKVVVLGISDVNFEEHNAYLLKRIEKFREISEN